MMGSESDLDKMMGAVDLLKQFKVNYRVEIASAHRTPERVMDIIKTGEAKGVGVIIAGAGGSAHLPGMIASYTTIPVIGVPISTEALRGLDSLYSMVQMPSGVPVATVGIDSSKNAGLLAIAILATAKANLKRELEDYRYNMKVQIEERSSSLDI